jgi:NIPSNAP
MILARDVFYLKFGKAKEARSVITEGKALVNKLGYTKTRAMMDLVGHSYTMVLEMEWESLAEMENKSKTAFADKDWQNWYQKFVPLVDSSYREIFTIIE